MNASCAEKFEAKFVHPKAGRTLVVGSKVYPGRVDRRQSFTDAVGVDMLPGEGVDIMANLEDGIPEGLGQFDHIDCVSVLEHSQKPWCLAAALEYALKPGGTIFVSVPFVWRIHAYPSDYWRFTPEAIRLLFPGIIWERLELAADKLRSGPGLPSVVSEGHVYMAKTETVGFGVKA